MNCLCLFATESKPKSHENVCKDYDYCHMVMSEECKNILKYNQDKKSLKAPFIIYADTESSLEKIHTYDNNPEESSITKISKHTACTYSVFIPAYLIIAKASMIFTGVINSMKKSCADMIRNNQL